MELDCHIDNEPFAAAIIEKDPRDRRPRRRAV
jgi:hypothetical protein